MDKDGNIIYDIIDPEMDMDGFNTDTSVPVQHEAIHTSPITGEPEEIPTRGVQEDIAGDNTEADIDDNEGNISTHLQNEYDDDASIENESPEDQHVTINNIQYKKLMQDNQDCAHKLAKKFMSHQDIPNQTYP